jgi:hypothetical protein
MGGSTRPRTSRDSVPIPGSNRAASVARIATRPANACLTFGAAVCGKYHEAPLTAEIVSIAQGLYVIAERGDRLIAATAIALGLPLITRDPEIGKLAGLECIWK